MDIAAETRTETIVLKGRKVVGGRSEGEALVTSETISGWGGINERSGAIIERRHELRGVSFAGKVLVFPGAKGSSGWSAYFHMTRLNGVQPAAMIFTRMTKKIALACAMIHAPRLLVLDEPFESVDPVSAANLTEILERYVGGGGTVVLSSHGMDLIERVCDSVAVVVGGKVLAAGTLDEVRRGETLEDRFVELAGGRKAAEGMEWLHSFAD